MDPKVVCIIAGCVISILNFLVPGYVTYTLRKSDQINQIPYGFLRFCHFCVITWLIYSIFLFDFGLILVNGICTAISFINLFLFAFYSKRLLEYLPQYIVISLVVVSVSLMLARIDALGPLCTVFNIITSFSLLESVYKVYSTKNYAYIDITISISNLVNGTIWNFYGYLISNLPIIISNVILIGVALILIAFHVIFRYSYRNIDTLDKFS